MKKKANLIGMTTLHVEDVADVLAPKSLTERIKKLKIYSINDNIDKEKKLLIDVIDVIRSIDRSYPGNSINCLGEVKTVVQYFPTHKKESRAFSYLKVCLVFLIILIGSSTAIMTFHTDAQLPQIFKTYSFIFTGEITAKPYLVDIPYSLGLAFGIIMFFNHLFKKKFTNDPTPVEIEMTQYENDATNCVADMMLANGEKEHDGK